MPAIVRSEFALALNQIATERGINPEIVLESIEAAILAAYRKDYGNQDLTELEVKINPKTGEAKLIKNKKDITPAGFGRIAAQTAKQVILQRIREAEKKAIIADYSTRVGTITNGMVLRFNGREVIIDIGKTEAIMPPAEQIPLEHYRLNQRLTFYIVEIKESLRGNQIIVSRAHKNLLSGLFKREVPEVASGAVEIKEIAREPGTRSKIAVYSNQPGVDPVGSCVGQKGIRVQAVINEIGSVEKVDIVQWNENPQLFIQAALAPAKDIEVILDEKKKVADAFISEDQLSLAIGKEGQNVRLAGRLTGWKIDIKPKSETVSTPAADIKTTKDTKEKEEEKKEKDKKKKPEDKKGRKVKRRKKIKKKKKVKKG